jgi:ribose 5-phosphate isomerase B
MRIHMGANYEGYALGRELETWVKGLGHEVVWHGADEYDFDDDYPLFAFRIGQAVIADEDAALEVRGVLVGGIGGGETIATNKVPGARAVFGHSVDFVTKSREHANASILVVGALNTAADEAKAMIQAIIDAKFTNVLDDARRIVNTNEYEASKTIEGWMITG